MANIWQKEWYYGKSTEMLEVRYGRKPFALAFIICATFFFAGCMTKALMGLPTNPLAIVIAVVLLLIGCVWFRVAYLSQEELKRRGELDG